MRVGRGKCGPIPLKISTRAKAGTYVVAEVARLRGFTPNTRILANSATKILNGVGCEPVFLDTFLHESCWAAPAISPVPLS